jgi:hypothetical protein
VATESMGMIRRRDCERAVLRRSGLGMVEESRALWRLERYAVRKGVLGGSCEWGEMVLSIRATLGRDG